MICGILCMPVIVTEAALLEKANRANPFGLICFLHLHLPVKGQICHQSETAGTLSIDHIIPSSCSPVIVMYKIS